MTTNGNTAFYRWAIGILAGVLLAVFGFMGGVYRAEAGMEEYKTQVTTNTEAIKAINTTLSDLKNGQGTLDTKITTLNTNINALLLQGGSRR